MLNVFVSYSTRDLPNVEGLRRALHGTDINVFVAEHSVGPGQQLASDISKAIEQCDLFVLLWSRNAQASEWVSQEIGRAHALNKPILPLLLTPGLDLPGFIHGLKFLPVHKNPAAAIETAKNIILGHYNQKKKTAEALTLIGLGALLFWAFAQK